MARYDKLILLGSGSYGSAWVVKHKNKEKEKKVMKEIKLNGLGETDIERAMTEVAILANCHHDNIISYTEAFVDRRDMRLFIVMDYASGGDLHKEISQRRGLYFPDEIILRWFAQLISALSYIHQRSILHRDIKPQNLFLTESGILKLGDFGISRILHGDTDVALTFIGTPFYLSPEICRQQPYNYKSDMWAAGCVLYELCCLRVPFHAATLPSLASLIEMGVYDPLPSHCDASLSELIGSLLTADPEKRPSASELLQHPEMQKYLDQRPRKTKQISCEDITNFSEGRRPVSPGQGKIMRKRVADRDTEKENEDCCSRESPGHINRELVKQNLARKVDSTTYTVVKHPKVRRLSLASPELSAMIEQQRTQRHETQRAHSVDAPRPQRVKKQNPSPKLSLLRSMQQMKRGEAVSKNAGVTDDGDDHIHDTDQKKYNKDRMSSHLTKAMYQSFISDTPPSEMAAEVLGHLTNILGQCETEDLIAAVKSKTDYEDLCRRFDIHASSLLAVMWHLTMTERKSSSYS